MPRYSLEPRTRKYVRGYGFLSFGRNLTNKYGKQLLDFATKTRVDPLKTASQKVIHNIILKPCHINYFFLPTKV